MYYLIQSNIHADPEHYKVFEVLEDLGLPYETIELTGNTTSIELETDRADVFVYGSVKLARLCKEKTHWNPGSFYGGNHNYEVNAKHYKEHLLNFNSQKGTFGKSLEWQPNETKFIKPFKDAKVFTGRVFHQYDWEDFVEDQLANPRTPMLHAETEIQISVPQTVHKEARVWIVGGQVVAAVYYKFHEDAPFEQHVSEDGIAFAKEMAQCFEVAPAFVMDIGLTDNGWKIVEVNCINSAGFYQLNVRTLFRALEAFFG